MQNTHFYDGKLTPAEKTIYKDSDMTAMFNNLIVKINDYKKIDPTIKENAVKAIQLKDSSRTTD